MKISIIGGGWLGLSLAQSLLAKNYQVVVTKREREGIAKAESLGVDGIQFSLGDELSAPELTPLFDADLLFLNIPPGRKSFAAERFVGNMRQLIRYARHQGVSRCIFISTTSVYGDKSRTVYEYSAVEPVTQSAQAHVDLERIVREVFAKDGAILRLSGLIGGERHPARFMAGRKNIENGQQRVNLVHRDDVIAAVEKLIELDKFGQTYHLSATDHPTRAEYYTQAAKALNLPVPEFLDDVGGVSGKQINCSLTLNCFEMTLKYPSPFNMI